MTYRVRLARGADSYLQRLDSRTQERFAKLFVQLSESPLEHSKPLRGLGSRRSARVGSWRVIFEVDIENQTILVSDLGPRGQIYRELGR